MLSRDKQNQKFAENSMMINFFKTKTRLTSRAVTSAKIAEVQVENQQEMSAIKDRVTSAALKRDLYFGDPRKIALISGAGIAGLAASFELLARGFNVIIAEKRKDFSRFNVINLDVETQRFLKKFNLLNEFEDFVAARIESHSVNVFSKQDGFEELQHSDVSNVQMSDLLFEPQFFNQLFTEDAIYSVRISDLQTFLANKLLDAGAHILGNVEVLANIPEEDLSDVEIAGHDRILVQPDLFFVAEGAHSTTAKQHKMAMNDVINDCTGENWIFGNVEYFGDKTFVFAMIDTSGEKLEIANIIFNAKLKEINIAVTSEKGLSKELINKRILETVNRVSAYLFNSTSESVIKAVERPVHINNQQCMEYSKNNMFYIGDAAGHSSPLAGMGGTLGLTLIPHTIERLLNDHDRNLAQMHDNFGIFSASYTSRWIEKSQAIKQHCIRFFEAKKLLLSNQEQISNMECELNLKNEAPK